jgi:hypothetical protein
MTRPDGDAVLLRKLPADLGALVESHRPLHPVVGWAIIAALSVPFALWAALGAPGPLVGLAILLGLGLPFLYMFAELLLLEHRLYEHGIVFRSIPTLNVYVVPHSTIDPDQIVFGGRPMQPGQVQRPDRRYRLCPLVKDTIDISGLDPKYASWLGKNKLSWNEFGHWDGNRPVNATGAPIPVRVWRTSWRDAARHRDLIEATVRESRRGVIRRPAGS